MKIGYARVSTKEQHLDMQLEALKAAGCEKIFSEKMTGRQQNRPELEACLNFLREGDTLVVYKLDRLGRSLKNILTLLEDFKNRGIQLFMREPKKAEESPRKKVSNSAERHLSTKTTSPSRKAASSSMNPEHR